ncbi:hypothetical protein [Paenibacillus campi]|uniref:hypothetical protein n=1 Tax=Paenibacillus campi TaxID=3106031 RepID=UPI002AFE2177|nr:hypothetical protein [Paenibacillus sp. SGZ-1014]
MRALPLVNEQGYFVEDVLSEHFSTSTLLVEGVGTIIATPVPAGLYKLRWNFEQSRWEEALSVEEIAALQPVITETPEQKIARLEQHDLDNKELITSLYEMLLAQGGH